jgi:hypothetical protein
MAVVPGQHSREMVARGPAHPPGSYLLKQKPPLIQLFADVAQACFVLLICPIQTQAGVSHCPHQTHLVLMEVHLPFAILLLCFPATQDERCTTNPSQHLPVYMCSGGDSNR